MSENTQMDLLQLSNEDAVAITGGCATCEQERRIIASLKVQAQTYLKNARKAAEEGRWQDSLNYSARYDAVWAQVKHFVQQIAKRH